MPAYQPPRIVTRDEWNAQPPRSDGVARPVEALEGTVVHHQGVDVDADANPYTIVRGIQTYHQVGKGWSDIAYNTLVWRDGTVFLGRDAGVRGAHTVAPGTRDWNWTHLGVCILGMGDDPQFVTDEAWQSVLWCWQLAVWVTKGRATGFLTHRETGSPTVCAGDLVQWRMDTMRQFVAGLNTLDAA